MKWSKFGIEHTFSFLVLFYRTKTKRKLNKNKCLYFGAVKMYTGFSIFCKSRFEKMEWGQKNTPNETSAKCDFSQEHLEQYSHFREQRPTIHMETVSPVQIKQTFYRLTSHNKGIKAVLLLYIYNCSMFICDNIQNSFSNKLKAYYMLCGIQCACMLSNNDGKNNIPLISASNINRLTHHDNV